MDVQFWKACCERGISACRIPKPFKEEVTCWLVQKSPSFRDRQKWETDHTFDTDAEMVAAIEQYFISDIEPDTYRKWPRVCNVENPIN